MLGRVPLDTNDENEFWLRGDVKVSFLLGKTVQTNLFTLSILVLLDIRLRTLENNLTFRLGSLSISPYPDHSTAKED
jgi:hypothetical protein